MHLPFLHVAEVSVRTVEQAGGLLAEDGLRVSGYSVMRYPVEVHQVDGLGVCELGVVGFEGLGERTYQLLPGIFASRLGDELQLVKVGEAAEVETGCHSAVGSCDPELLEHLVAGGNDLLNGCRLIGNIREVALAVDDLHDDGAVALVLGHLLDGLVAPLSLKVDDNLALANLLAAGDVVLQILDGVRQSGHVVLKPPRLLHEAEPVASPGEEDVAEVLEIHQACSKRRPGLVPQSAGVFVQAERDEVAEERKVVEVGHADQLVQQHGQLEQRVEALIWSLVHVGRHGVEGLVDVCQARVRLPVVPLRPGRHYELAWQLGADSLVTQAACGDDLRPDGRVVRDVESEQQLLELPLGVSIQLLIGDIDVDDDLVALLVPLLIDDSDRFE